MIRYFSALLFAALFIISAPAQDLQFSQFNAIPQLLNPAATGFLPHGRHRLALQHRAQWDNTWTENAYTGLAAAYDFRLCTRHNFWAFGLALTSDWAGSGAFFNRYGLLSAAYHQALGGGIYGTVGFATGGLQYGLDKAKLRYDAQFDGYNYDPQRDNQEITLLENRFQPDMNAGFQIYQVRRGWMLGLAFQHLNQPTYSLLQAQEDGNENRLGTGLALHGTLAFGRKQQGMTRFLLRKQSVIGANSQQWQLLWGGNWAWPLSKGSAFAPGLLLRMNSRQDHALALGSLVFETQLRFPNTTLRLSYDVDATPRTGHFAGGLELSAAWFWGDEQACIVCPH